MAILDIILAAKRPIFSLEVLPPLKGAGMERLFETVDKLREFDPKYINITTHRSEYVSRTEADGAIYRRRVRRRPGTVAVAAALKHRYDLPVVPHVLCSGFTREETEYVLLDLQFLGITDLLLLRGDKAPHENYFLPEMGGNAHTLQLQEQVKRFNQGVFEDGLPLKEQMPSFRYGVACYPEGHSEATNEDTDMVWLKRKVEAGAEYLVTQMFFDNAVYFDFVRRAREAGITIPIIPGIKPFGRLSQREALPRLFNLTLPDEMLQGIDSCRTDADAADFGVAWSIQQCKELLAGGAAGIHFYSMGVADGIRRIAQEIY